MPRFRIGLRLRLRTLLIVIAIIGVGFGAYRWWVGRQEILSMAEDHRQRSLGRVALFERIRRLDLLRLDLRLETLRLSKVPDEEEPVTPPEQVLRDESRIEVELDDARIASMTDSARWHLARAKELESKWVFILERERGRDRAQLVHEQKEEDRHIYEQYSRKIVLLDHYAELEEERALQLIDRLGADPQTLPADSPERRRIDFHLRKAAELRESSQRERDSASTFLRTDQQIAAQVDKLLASPPLPSPPAPGL
ncbi:MAG TPA: hypothetical protein VGZ22_13825 [Isosphaeraceae bacterium]|jgi:hypothetical protein|nr:hypothetical protein [Isosphaeraceae bacterium]